MDKSSKEDDFDPFNPTPNIKDDLDDNSKKKENNDISILYITGGIIMLIIIIWVIILIMTKNDNIEILNEMSKTSNQVKLAIDTKK